MSKASNQSKRFRQVKTRQRSNKVGGQNEKRSAASSSHSMRSRSGETRNRKRRDSWVKKNAGAASSVKSSSSPATSNKPLVRGSLQRVLTKSGKKSSISEISREATAGGVIYRLQNGMLQILLVADHYGRWTIPKGHIEEGETAQETAIREIGEEAGVHQLESICWLGKIHFRYRRENILVLMSTQIYLFKALGDTDDIQKEDWMNDIRWFNYREAIDVIAYKDIAKLMNLAHRRLVQRGEIDGEE